MYLDFYGLQQDPFSNTAASDMLFLSESHKAALRAIIDGLHAGQEFITLLGEPGLGKTFLLHAALAHSDLQHIRAIHIFYPHLSAYDILQMICWELGCDDGTQGVEQLIASFCHALLTEHKRGLKVVLVIDEADTVPRETLERLLWLAQLRASTGKPLLQVVLAGLPALWQHGNGALLRSFKKGLATRVTLAPLTYAESLAYIRHRLLQAGAYEDTVCTAEAVQKIARYARGNPRVMNMLCTNLLIDGFVAKQKPIPATTARDVVAAHRAKNASPLWRRGVAYAAGVLVAVGLAAALQYGHRAVPVPDSHDLAQLTQRPQDLSRADTAPQPVTIGASPPLTALSAPPSQEEGPFSTAAQYSAVQDEQGRDVAPSPLAWERPDGPAPTQSRQGGDRGEKREGGDTGAPQMAAQDVSPLLKAGPSAHPVVGPEQPATLQEPPPPVGPFKPGRMAERPHKSQPRSGTPRVAALPPLQRTPPAAPPDKEDGPPAGTVPAEDRAPAVAPERSAALPESPPPAVPSKTMRDPERFNPRAVQKERRATQPAGDSVAPQDSTQRAVAVSHVDESPDTFWPEGPPRLVVETGGHTAMIRKLLFTADGHDLVSVSDDKTIRVWAVAPDGRRATLARTLRGSLGEGREGTLAAASLSPPEADGRQRWLAVGGLLAGTAEERYAIRLHDYASGEVVALLCGHTDAILALAFSPAGRWLASAGKDGTIRLWDLAALQGHTLTQAPVVLTGHSDHIYELAWAASGARLASASYDHTVGLWDTTQLAQLRVSLVARLRGHEAPVQTVAFHPSGAVLASGGKDQAIRLWQAGDGAALGVWARAPHKVAALAFAPDGSRVLAGNFAPPQPDRLTLWAYPSGTPERVFRGHANVVVATAFHPRGQWVATGGGDHKEILLWQVASGEVLARLEGRGRTIYAVGFSPDGRYLSWGQTAAYSGPNRQGPLEHRFDLAQLTRLPGGLAEAAPVQARERLGPLALVLAPGGLGQPQARLHVQDGGRRRSTLERGPSDGYRHSAYTLTPDGQGVLSGGANGVLRLYGLDGSLWGELVGHTGEIKAVAVSADGRWALSGANDQTLCLWALPPGPPGHPSVFRPALTLFPAQDGEWVAWTPEGQVVASARGLGLIGASVNQGLEKLARYVAGEHLRERFYRPELIRAKLHGESGQPLQSTVRLHTDQ